MVEYRKFQDFSDSLNNGEEVHVGLFRSGEISGLIASTSYTLEIRASNGLFKTEKRVSVSDATREFVDYMKMLGELKKKKRIKVKYRL